MTFSPTHSWQEIPDDAGPMPAGLEYKMGLEEGGKKYVRLAPDNQAIALNLARHGWKVFPCRNDKSPFTSRGYKDATADSRKVAIYWKNFKDALIGIPCVPNGFFVLDIDKKNGVDGQETLDKWGEEYGSFEVGPVQRTPSGGIHLFFKLPTNGKVPNNSNRLAPGLDLRSDGYVCSGGPYEWQQGHNFDAPLTEAPDWLLQKIDALNKPPTPAAQTFIPQNNNGNGHNSGEKWLLEALAKASPRNRNETGLWLAGQLRDDNMSFSEAEAIMAQYAAQVPGDDYTADEALASLKSAYSKSPRQPAANIAAGVNVSPPPVTPSAQPAEKKERFIIRDAAFALSPQPPIDWIIEKIFSAGSVSLVVGPPGSKKTRSLLSAAVRVAMGANWLEFPTKQGAALFIDEESGERRFARWLGDALRGEVAPADTEIFFVSLARLNLHKNNDDALVIVDLIKKTNAQFVVLDALADLMPGGDENAVKDTHPVFMRLRYIAEITGAALVLIHHANKTGDYRGSTAMEGAVDSLIMVDSKAGSDTINFETKKAREIPNL